MRQDIHHVLHEPARYHRGRNERVMEDRRKSKQIVKNLHREIIKLDGCSNDLFTHFEGSYREFPCPGCDECMVEDYLDVDEKFDLPSKRNMFPPDWWRFDRRNLSFAALRRFFRKHVGRNWDDVFSELMMIPMSPNERHTILKYLPVELNAYMDENGIILRSDGRPVYSSLAVVDGILIKVERQSRHAIQRFEKKKVREILRASAWADPKRKHICYVKQDNMYYELIQIEGHISRYKAWVQGDYVWLEHVCTPAHLCERIYAARLKTGTHQLFHHSQYYIRNMPEFDGLRAWVARLANKSVVGYIRRQLSSRDVRRLINAGVIQHNNN